MCCARLARGRKLGIIQIHANHRGPFERCRRNRSQAYPAASEYRHSVARCDASARRGMEPNRQRLYQAHLFQ